MLSVFRCSTFFINGDVLLSGTHYELLVLKTGLYEVTLIARGPIEYIINISTCKGSHVVLRNNFLTFASLNSECG